MQEIVTVFGVNWKLFLVQAVNFGLLLVILHRFLYRPVLAMIDARRATIEKGVREAERAAMELSKAEVEKARILREAIHKGDMLIDTAKKNAETEEQALLKDAHRKVAHLINEAERRTAREHEEMLKSVEREVARMAVLSAEKVLRKS